jgi:osmoprotectant transport system permease protein
VASVHARSRRFDPLGVLLTALSAIALLTLPFVVFKANRIVPGEPRALLEVLGAPLTPVLHALLAATAIVAMRGRNPRWRLCVALAALVAVQVALALAASTLTPPGNRVVRVAPGAAFWIVTIALALLATDALTRLKLGAARRLASLVVVLAVVAAALHSGFFDDLSIMREYTVNAARFAREARQHVLLALGSLAAAVVVALPLGIACHRRATLRAIALGTLNFVQTIPSIALFGILMAPLAALAVALPALASIGVSGIGTAPAIVALFLYSLLPIVGNTAVGLARVAPAAVDAARGMGLTDTQVLRQVELPLAMPTILTGIRIVLVQNIGLATIAALIGGGGLGAFVFQGIGQTAIDLVLLGAIPIVTLAFSASVVLDALTDLTRRVPR